MVYIPFGKAVTINCSSIKSKKIQAHWFNPKNGESTIIGKVKNTGNIEFTTPSAGFENDWVLVLDNQASKYKIPY